MDKLQVPQSQGAGDTERDRLHKKAAKYLIKTKETLFFEDFVVACLILQVN